MERTRDNQKKLLIFFGLFIFFYAAFMIFSAVMASKGYEYPIGDFRFFRHDIFKDFSTINNAVCDRNPYLSELSNYPPIILAFAYIFSKMADYSGYDMFTMRFACEDPAVQKSIVLFFGLCIVAFLCVIMYHAYLQNKGQSTKTFKERAVRFLTAGAVGAALLLSAPSVFLFDRGNYLALTIVFFMLWAVFEEEKPDSVLGAVFAALCAATKVYPLYILLIYVFEKKYKKFFWAMVTGAVVTIVPIFFFKGGYIANVIAFIKGVLGFGGGAGMYAVYFNVGVTGLVGFIGRIFGFTPNVRLIKIVWFFGGVLFTLIGLPFLKDEKIRWKKLLVLTAIMVFLTPNSYLYNTAYMFAPIYVMLMNRDKMAKRDYVYVVIAALMLVPKAYFYLPDIPGVIPLEYNTVNIAVLIDALLYLGLITFYFGEKIYELAKEDRRILADRSISTFRFSRRQSTLVYGVAALGCIAALATIIWNVHDTVLASHDSFYDFVEARILGASIGFKRAFEFGLARGRVGVIFPCVVYIRYLINAKGNFLAIWLMQYLPFFANIALISYILGKKFSRRYGVAFALIFMGFLQIDIWHNVITSYPLDFMYGLFIMILGLYMYSEYLSKKGSSKLNVIRLILSVILYYESMQVYESFIVSSLIYAIITVAYIKRDKMKLFSANGIKRFFLSLLPHIITALIYLGIMVYLRKNPVVERPVIEIARTPFSDFVLPYIVFSIGMFPMSGIRVIASIKETFLHPSLIGLAFSFFTALGLTAMALEFLVYYRTLKTLERKKELSKLIVMFCMGVALAMTFAIPHSMIPSYQEWVNVGHVGGYVPTTICYFGWIVALVALFAGIIYYASYRSHKFHMFFLGAVMVIVFIMCYLTFAINVAYRLTNHVTGREISLRAQNFYALINDDWFKEREPQYIYSPDMMGVHYKLDTDEALAEHIMGYNMEIINDGEEADYIARTVTQDIAYYRYDLDAEVGYVTHVPDYDASEFLMNTHDDIYFFTTYPGTFEISYECFDGTRKSETVELGKGAGYMMDIQDQILVNSVDVARVG